MFKKRIVPEGDIYEKLCEIRKEKGISLETIHRETKIPLKHLKALEEGSINMLPDILYTKNIIKKYLSLLDVDAKPFITRLTVDVAPIQDPKKSLGFKSLMVVPRIIKAGIAIALIAGFIIYLIFAINKIFKPPSIIITSPEEGETVTTSIINIEGYTDQGTNIFINSEQVILDKDNNFNKELNLQKGLNLIKISGINRYSKENIIWRNVILNINTNQ